MIPDKNMLLSFFPIEGEELRNYAERCNIIIAELSGQLQNHLAFWTHRQPAPCPICNYENLCRNMAMMMLDLVSLMESKNYKIKCFRPENTHSADQFEFKIYPRG